MKRLTLAIVILLGICINAYAQNVVKHVVKRGETLSSIAKAYGTTEHEIKELNPNVKTFIYAGMELNMPSGNKMKEDRINMEGKGAIVLNYQDNTLQDSSESNKITPWSFSSYSVSYMASFDYADQGYYMFGGSVYAPENWGIDLYFGCNMGLVETGYSGAIFMIGPAYAYSTGKVLLSSSLDFVGGYSGTGPAEVRRANNIKKEFQFLWGFALEPKMTLKLGKVFPWFGLPIQWAEGSSKLSVCFHIGLGFDF